MYTEAVRLNQGYGEAWNNLGCACSALQEPDHAVEAYRMALKANQNCKKTRENMAICLLEVGCRHLKDKNFKQAASMLKEALVYDSKNADIFFHLGVTYAESNKLPKAKVQYELATHFDERHAHAWNNQGVIHRREGNPEAAMHCFQKALEANPDMHLANKNLAAIYGTMGRMQESIKLTRVALESNPNDAEAHNNLALLLRDQGDLEVCLEHLDACLKLEPKNPHACSNRLMTLNYFSTLTREEVFDAHRSFGEEVERRVQLDPPLWKSPGSGDRLLHIGYISPDFYRHSVSYFIHAALVNHDPTCVHVTCYSDVAAEDDKTQLFRSLAHRWRHTHGVSDEEVARMIRDDGIDILVELTGHTGNNRLAMIARRPAGIAVTWIGYPHTTGMSRVDYRISDERADPADSPGLTTEKLVYLPECFLCHTPPDNAPPIRLQLAQESYGCITFGCFNNLSKVSPLTLNLWCRLLHEVPEARLFLKSKALLCPEVQEKYRRAFVTQGIEAHRVDLSGLQPHTGSHLQMYNFVDVALDTAPYAGTTTTCEALYMGVPVVTLRGRGIHAQNVGHSLLATVQLEDLAANSEEEYVQIASALGRNVKRLGALRAGLRTRMERSPLCDGLGHTRRLERLYANLAARGPTASSATDTPEQAMPAEPQ
jgi:predicted O-linked N-acetylglucosamine transferase (SPINDLY family)